MPQVLEDTEKMYEGCTVERECHSQVKLLLAPSQNFRRAKPRIAKNCISYGQFFTEIQIMKSTAPHLNSETFLILHNKHYPYGYLRIPPLPMESPYFPDHNVSPTLVIMKENIEEGGGSVGNHGDMFFRWCVSKSFGSWCNR